ncbi:MAG: hypothetical protein D6746_06470 [Bacteroidetes bacterium]|nr:MAG: hypothetical protein D6746_06470 [Bacteroidota bacterium]
MAAKKRKRYTPEQQEKILKAYEKAENKTAVLEKAGISRATIYNWQRSRKQSDGAGRTVRRRRRKTTASTTDSFSIEPTEKGLVVHFQGMTITISR